MSVSATYNILLKGIETLDYGKLITHQITDGMSGTLTSSTTVPVTKAFSEERTLALGASYTYDLTALPDGQSFSGLKVQFFHARNSDSSADIIQIDARSTVTDNYPLFINANGVISLDIDTSFFLIGNDQINDVGATDRQITITNGANGTSYFQVVIIAG